MELGDINVNIQINTQLKVVDQRLAVSLLLRDNSIRSKNAAQRDRYS